MIVLNLKMLYLLAFVIALFTDYIITVGYLGKNIQKYYERFISMSAIKMGLVYLH